MVVVALYTLLGFFAAPPLIKSVAVRQLTEQLGRPVSIGRIALNPYRLRLEADDVHIGGRTDGEAFIDVGQLAVRVSWASLTHFAPVIGEVRIVRPQVHIIRTGAERFNFSDLTDTPPSPAAADEESRPLDLTIEKFSIADGTLSLRDESTATPTDFALTDLAAGFDGFSLIGRNPAAYSLSTGLASGGTLKVEGTFDLAAGQAQTSLSIDGLALPAMQPYLAAATPARVTAGTANASILARADWSKTPVEVTVSDSTLGLKDLRIALPDARAPALSLDTASVAIAKVDLASQNAEIGKIEISGLTADVQRHANGEIDLAALAAPSSGAVASGKARTEDAPSWHYKIAEIDLKGARVAFADATTPTPAKMDVSPLNVTARQLSDDLSAPVPVTLAATLNGKGALSLDGKVTPVPFKADLKLTGKNLDVTPFAPYASGALNARIASAVLNATGDAVFEQAKRGSRASYRGDLELAGVRVIDHSSSAVFAGWRSLALKGLKARYDAADGIDVDTARVVFSNFYGHVLLDEQGRLHLRDILAKNDDGGAGTAPLKTKADAAPATSEAMPVRLHFGGVELQNGQVTYTDNFIRPHYTAELAGLNGTIGAFGTNSTASAPINIGARLTANGPIAIKGKVNPLAVRPSLDLTAVAKDIELTNLTAYSTKYTGYPITKGKLNVDLHYRLADERLTADNHVFIDQLTFGDRVENSTATQLPVQLAVSLLKNSEGQIDVDIPVSGSLNDPQFSVSGLIWQAVGNLVRKAITAPFTLLAQAFGLDGGEDLGYVVFAPGSSVLPQAARDKLDTIAKMLAEKPSVTLDLTGRVDPGIDQPALLNAHADTLVRGRKAEPATVDNDSLRRLAQDRAQAVRHYLEGKIPDKRVFVVAPKLDAEGIDDQGATTRVDFSLR